LINPKISAITNCDMGTLNSAIIEKYICETQISIAYATKKDKKKRRDKGWQGQGGRPTDIEARRHIRTVAAWKNKRGRRRDREGRGMQRQTLEKKHVQFRIAWCHCSCLCYQS